MKFFFDITRNPKAMLGIIILALMVMIMLSFASCTATKNKKAVERVLTNRELLEQVGRQWEKNNPCANDTIETFAPGDTLIQIDTFTRIDIDTVTTEGATKTNTVYKTITKKITIHDTIKASVRDTRRERILTDTASFYRGESIAKSGQISVLKEELKEAKASRKHWIWNFWILIIIAGAWITRKLWLPLFGKI